MTLTATAINPVQDAALIVDQAVFALPGDEDSDDSQLLSALIFPVITLQPMVKNVNFDTIAAHDPFVSFIGIRVGISWGYQDPWFNFYFSEPSASIRNFPLPCSLPW